MNQGIYKETINAAIENIKKDSRVTNFLASNKYLANLQDEQKRNVFFSIFAISRILDLELEDVMKCITEGSNDGAIDAVYIDISVFDTAEVYIFNFKDPIKEQDGIQETEIKKVLCSLRRWPANPNEYLKTKIDEIESLKINPQIMRLNYHIYFVTSGCVSKDKRPSCIEFSELEYLGECKVIDAKLLCDYAFLKNEVSKEKFVLMYTNEYEVSHYYNDTAISSYVVDISAEQLLDMCHKYSESIFEYNVRNGLLSKINKGIVSTAQNQPELFWLFNNGITILCDSIEKSQTMKKLILKNPRIINGCQTATTLDSFFNGNSLFQENLKKINILTRLHVINEGMDQEQLMDQVITCTNSQNPIVVKDLKSRNKIQKLVQNYFSEKGVKLEICRGEFGSDIDFVRNDTIFQFYIAIYKQQPAQAKTSKTAVFNKNFDIVFSEKNKGISAHLYQAYQIRKFLLEKEQESTEEDKPLLENADLTLAYTMVKLNPALLEDQNLDGIALTYLKAISTIKQVVSIARNVIGNNFSYNNLFKNPIIIDLIEKQLAEENQEVNGAVIVDKNATEN